MSIELLRKCTWLAERMEIDGGDGTGQEERTEDKVYVMFTAKKKVMRDRESYNKRCILSQSCPEVLFSPNHFHQAVSFSPFRNFLFVYMHQLRGVRIIILVSSLFADFMFVNLLTPKMYL